MSEEQDQASCRTRAAYIEKITISLKEITLVGRNCCSRRRQFQKLIEVVLVPASAEHDKNIFELVALDAVLGRKWSMAVEISHERHHF